MTISDRLSAPRLGIDFGTSSTVAVFALPGRDPRPLLFDGSPLLPSAVCVDSTGRILVGRDALHMAMSRPDAFEPHPKQRVNDGTVLLGGTEITVQRLYQAVLDRVVAEARHSAGHSQDQPIEVVVTCPAAWGPQRRAILLQATQPGARLVEEPVAAAHHVAAVSGADLAEGRPAVVYDLGAGTFDAALIRRTGDGFTVVAAQGVPDCGGLDIDAAIVAHLAAALPDPAAWGRLDRPGTAADRRDRQQLWDNVRAGKEMLSRTSTTLIRLPILDIEVPLGRETLEELAAPILDRTVDTVRQVLQSSGVVAADLAAIYLTGGSSRMPAVVTLLHRAFGIMPTTVDQPELAVAEGSLHTPARPRTASDPAWPPMAQPATTPARPARSRARSITLTAAVTVGVLGIGASALWAANRDPPEKATWPGSSASPSQSPSSSPTPSPTPTYPPGIDPCLLGVWRITAYSYRSTIEGNEVQYSGGAGTTITIADDNTYTLDYAGTKPRVAVYRGMRFAETPDGTARLRYHADGERIIRSILGNKTTTVLRRDGTVISRSQLLFSMEPADYRCADDRLLITSSQGSHSTEAVKVRGP